VPLTVACEMVTFEPPEFVNVADLVCVLPSSTVPKLMLVVLAVS
jgi:hypothetical protein